MCVCVCVCVRARVCACLCLTNRGYVRTCTCMRVLVCDCVMCVYVFVRMVILGVKPCLHVLHMLLVRVYVGNTIHLTGSMMEDVYFLCR